MTMPKGLVRPSTQDRGKKRAARGLRRKIEVHAPGGHHRLDLRRFRNGASRKSRGAREQEAAKIEKRLCAFSARHADHKVRALANDGMGEPSRPKMCGASLAQKARQHRPPSRGNPSPTALRSRAAVFSRSLLTPNEIGVGREKDAGEAVGGRARKSETLRNKLVFMGGKRMAILQTRRGSSRRRFVAEAG